MMARRRVFVLVPLRPRPYEKDELCDCCGMGAVVARCWFDSPAEAFFESCWLCAELITVQAMIGCALQVVSGRKGN
jgi:hypothetical protein